jgi:hypothetical protein
VPELVLKQQVPQQLELVLKRLVRQQQVLAQKLE